jgi:hypothetical protein
MEPKVLLNVVYEKISHPPAGYHIEFDMPAPVMLDWQFNGRYLPTTTDDNFNNLLGLYHNWPAMQDLAYFFVRPYINKDLKFNGKNTLDEFQNENTIFTVEEIKNKPKSFKYVYPIHIGNASFLRYTDYFSISENVLEDARQGRACILFIYEMESDIRQNIDKFRSLVIQLRVPKKNVILLHGDLDTEYHKDEPYTYYASCTFPWWITDTNPATVQEKNKMIYELIPYNGNKLFLSYNRTLRTHKVAMLCYLSYNNLLERGIISCGDLTRWYYPIKRNLNINPLKIKLSTENLMRYNCYSPDNELIQVENHSRDTLTNPATYYVNNHFENTFVSLIIESVDDSIFLTEKIFKAIKLGHPFILFGGPKLLAKIKEFGFKTFDKWWSEDYDNPNTTLGRIEAIIEVMNYLATKSPHELMIMRDEMKDVLDYNQKLYNNIVLEKTDLKISFNRIIKDIQDNLLNN